MKFCILKCKTQKMTRKVYKDFGDNVVLTN